MSAFTCDDHPSTPFPDAEPSDSGSETETEDQLEFALVPGERFGWWAEHELDGQHAVAMVHGAIFNHRTRILLDSGASTSILSLDLARRLKLRLRNDCQLQVKGMGGVTTNISARARVKVALGRVVYVMELWVGNIGDGVECLLGMDFMFAAGVRLCTREGVVRLPDEESLLLIGGPEVNHTGYNVSVTIRETVRLQPGEGMVMPVKYCQADPETAVIWTGRGDNWVTQVIHGSQGRAVAVKVVNVSDDVVRIEQHTAVLRLIEPGYLPREERFVRPATPKYREWQQLIYEFEPSREFRRREEFLAREAERDAPPAVETRKYPWPKRMLVRRGSDARPMTAPAFTVTVASTSQSTDGPESQPRSKEHSPVREGECVGSTSGCAEPVVNGPENDASETSGDASVDTRANASSARLVGGGITTQASRRELARTFPSDPMSFVADPVARLRQSFARCMLLEATDLAEEATVYFHEGNELLYQLRDQLAVLPELPDLNPSADLEKADVGSKDETTPEMNAQIREILERHHSIFLGDGNAVPTPARGVVCDLDVGGAEPVAQRSRQIAPHLLPKVFELLKKLLETGLIEHSESEWASPIVIVMKKNGVDIRLCIDYRLVNQLITLSHYPLPLIDDLLIGFERAMWFLSLDMASGFWAVPMTLRARWISAFICPFGHFQWVRMPFGLKNAPLIYQQMLNNCLWGFVRLPPSEEAGVDPEVLEFLGIKAEQVRCGEDLPALTEAITVFHRNIPAPPQMNPVLGRSSYIDDIAYGAETWKQLCEDLDKLLYRLRYWGISVSLPKSEFGKKSISYLSHEIGVEGIRAKPKIAKGVADLPFPKTLKGVQSFLGSLNYYNKFIEDLPVIASVLYELTDEQIRQGRDLSRAKEAFEILKQKIVSTPLLMHPIRGKQFVVLVHANPWAACAVLGQEHDGIIRPVRFTGRTLHDSELKYHPAEKEVVALLRVLRVFKTLVVGCRLKVYTRYSVLSWLFKSKTLEGRCLQWAAMLSPWSMEIHRVERDEDGLAAILGAGITPREHLDKIAETLVPAKGMIAPAPPISLEMLEDSYEGYLLSFDGAAKLSDQRGSAGCVLWRLPGWEVVEARGYHFEGVTVNEAEYQGMIHGARLALEKGVFDLVMVGDSRIAIQQAQGLIQCLKPGLQLLLTEFEKVRRQFRSMRLVHVKREFNAAADYLTSKTLMARKSVVIDDPDELSQLQQLNRIQEKLMKEAEPSPGTVPLSGEDGLGNISTADLSPPAREGASELLTPDAAVFVTTRSQARAVSVGDVPIAGAGANPTEVPNGGILEAEAPVGLLDSGMPAAAITERWRRICVHQDAEPWMRRLKLYLAGNIEGLSRAETRDIVKISDQYVLDARDVLFYLSRPTPGRPRDAKERLRLVIPGSLRQELLHHCHEDFQGGHQGITRTYERLRQEYYWPGMYADVERFVKQCVDCVTAKGAPPNPGPSPGNILATRPFEVVSMDFVTHLPKSDRGNTFLLLFQCAFSGFVICRPMSSTTAQDVAEAYEECVFRRFGASSMLRHDRDPRFMSEVFTQFREMLGSRQRATLAYRPQANGQQERSVQTVIRAVRAYVSEPDQSDWDDQVEKLMWALNTSFDATRLDTPFYLVHGWDAKSTVSAMLGPPPSGTDQRNAYEWRRGVQRDYEFAQAWARDLQAEAKERRSEAQTEQWLQLSERLKAGFEVGDAVWLYLARVQPGLSKKLAHLWHGPFRILETTGDFRVRLKIEGTGYKVYPWVHVSRLKPRALFPERPQVELEISEDDDFDAALLPEDALEPDAQRDQYEVEAILDVRWSKRTRTSRRAKEYLVKWKGYEETQWLPSAQLNCGALLYEFSQSARARARFRAMQAGDEFPDAEVP